MCFAYNIKVEFQMKTDFVKSLRLLKEHYRIGKEKSSKMMIVENIPWNIPYEMSYLKRNK